MTTAAPSTDLRADILALKEERNAVILAHNYQIAEIQEIGRIMRAMLKEEGPPPEGRWADLALLEPVRPYKSRHASTLLVFEAIDKAIAAHRARDEMGAAANA